MNAASRKSKKEKSEKIWMEKYGVTNPFADPIIIAQLQETKLKKYGNKHYNNRTKANSTFIEKYGVSHPSKIPAAIEKRTRTRTNKFLNSIFDGNRLKNLITPLWTREQFTTVQEEYPFQCNKCKTIFDDNLEDGKVPKCPKCFKRNNISILEIEFLDRLKINIRQKYIKPFKVDGIKNNKIFEFLGDYWHGNPNRFNHSYMNKKVGKSFGELYYNTIKKFNALFDRSYTIYYMWEADYVQWMKSKKHPFPLKIFNPNKLI